MSTKSAPLPTAEDLAMERLTAESDIGAVDRNASAISLPKTRVSTTPTTTTSTTTR